MEVAIVAKSRCSDSPGCLLNMISSVFLPFTAALCVFLFYPQVRGHMTFCSLKRGHTGASPPHVCGSLRINIDTRRVSKQRRKLDCPLPAW